MGIFTECNYRGITMQLTVKECRELTKLAMVARSTPYIYTGEGTNLSDGAWDVFNRKWAEVCQKYGIESSKDYGFNPKTREIVKAGK
jgi:hypothetical protein